MNTTSLSDLAHKHGTDKGPQGHNYTPIYERYLQTYRGKYLVLLEIGIGGYEYPERGGESLRMWADYFPQGKIVGVDLHRKEMSLPNNVEIYQGSQIDGAFLKDVVQRTGQPHVIVDDGSHVNEMTVQTFCNLFPLLRSGGTYIVEDVHTSYWVQEYGGNPDPSADLTTMGFFRKLTNQLNYEVLASQYREEWAPTIEYIHFFKELIIIGKK